MGTRVKVPQDSGTIVLQSVDLGYTADEKFTVHGGYVDVEDKHLDLFLKHVNGAEAAPVAQAPQTDKTDPKNK